MSDVPLRFGAVLRQAREAQNLTQTALGAGVGVNQPSVSAWESGDAFPTSGSLVRIARVLNLDLVDLIERIAAERDDERDDAGAVA